MSSSVTVIGGVNHGTLTGLVSVPVTGLGTGAAALQTALTALSTGVQLGAIGLVNDNAITGAAFASTIAGTANVLEITNTDSTGAVTSGNVGSTFGAVGVSSVYGAVIVQAPGTITVNGSGVTNTTYVLGAASNVDLSTNGGNNTIVAAGGQDTLNLMGSNAATISSGQDTVRTYAGSNTVVATGSASVFAGTPTGNAGSLNFVNSGTGTATVLSNAGSATASGGSGGGAFVGGTSGNNSLVGGTGSVTLVGGGNNDFLSANSTGTGSNYLFSGFGNETLLASSTTGSNLFAADGGTDVISTAGSGNQYFFGGTASATMTGSTTSGANNIYFFGNPTSTGGNDIITNFNSQSKLFAIDGANITTITASSTGGIPGALVSLSDGTHITLVGVTASSIQGASGGSAIVG